jgi:hypothetical protein
LFSALEILSVSLAFISPDLGIPGIGGGAIRSRDEVEGE